MSTNSLQPRVYRSSEGCCICRAKSSSSRFTDSSKYENDSMKCFDLKNPRVGEICNACVLLVKRYKRLPVGSTRNWGHVVDARAGTKSLTKSKRHREDSENSGSNQGSSTQKQQQVNNTSKSLIPEKFAKIFKKTKKHKLNITTKQKKECGKRKSSPPIATGIAVTQNSWVAAGSHESLPTTPESLDSEMMDDNQKMIAPNGRVVEFQTQTRASAHKSRSNMATAPPMAANRITQKVSQSMAMGSRRRKLLWPKRNSRANDNVQFFDETAWQLKKSCCGLALECKAVPNVFIMDLAQCKPCNQHMKKTQQKVEKLPVQPVKTQSEPPPQAQILPQQQTVVYTPPQPPPQVQQPLPQTQTYSHAPQQAHGSSQTPPQAQILPQKPLVTTLPAVVQLAPPAAPVANTNTTQALKKHHLFFKRQSECFPQGDMGNGVNYVNNNKCTTSAQAPIKVAPNANIVAPQLQQHHHMQQQQQPPPQLPFLQDFVQYNKQHQTYKITSMQLDPSTAQTIVGLENVTTSSPSKSRNTAPRHSMAKVTTITPNPNTTITTATANGKQHGFLHKIKDTGKIVKNSIDRINASVRIKPSEMQEFKQMMKTTDKTCIVPPKPVINTTVTYTGHPQHPPLPLNSTTVPLPQTSSSSTKFSDNSSDSGFDENLHDRKSASPFQDDNDKKMLSRPAPGVQTMFLASGVQIQGQQQNLVLTGNEVAAKFLQNRKQTTITSMHQPQQNRMNPTTTTAVKIAQILNESNSGVHAVGGAPIGAGMNAPVTHQKMRAIYNNNNTIQHENGITTIVPASSPAATSQTAAMNNIAPSSVTITPAPHIATVPVSTTLTNLANGKKLPSGTNLINLNHNMHTVNQVSANNHININSGAITINSNNPQSNMMNGILGQHLNAMSSNTNGSNMNQKIILVKTTPKYGNGNHNPVGPYMANQVGPSNVANTASVTLSKSTLNHFKQSVCKN